MTLHTGTPLEWEATSTDVMDVAEEKSMNEISTSLKLVKQAQDALEEVESDEEVIQISITEVRNILAIAQSYLLVMEDYMGDN